LGDEADTWRYLIEPLSRRWRVVAPDLPGFGRSPSLPAGASFARFEQTLLELLEALGPQRCLLAGHSLGGLLAQAVALRRPDQVAGLVLLDGGLAVRSQPLSLSMLLFLLPGLGEWLYNRLRRDSQAAFETLRPYYAELEALPPAERDFLYRRVNQRVWSDKQRRAYLSTLRSLVSTVSRLQKGFAAKLALLDVPTLVIWGQVDRINSLENGQALVQLQPSARLAVIPDAGHMPHQERPQAVLEAVLSDDRF
jgi:pimeloyl-ACP methyl ester carboxylesterase